MKKEDLRIVFMGTPQFAVESLKALVEGGYHIVGVVTVADKPVGRGYKIQFSPVKEYALSQNLPLLQPEKLKDSEFISNLQEWKADLQIVVAFRMLPEIVWNMPKYGTFNLHGSLLPQYRGAAPINWAIINGEKETGVTTFFLSHEIDTGNIIAQRKIAIEDSDNVGTVHDKLMHIGAELVTKTVDNILEDEIKTIPQENLIHKEKNLHQAPKIFKETCEITKNLTVEAAHNLVRGLSPYPAAWINATFPHLDSEIQMKVFESFPEKISHNETIGSLRIEGKKEMKIALQDGFLHLLEIQIPSKKRLKTVDFLNGI